MHWMDHGWGMAGGMWLFWLLVLLVLVGLVVWIVRQTGGRTGTGPVSDKTGDPAEEVLRKRYARGEIERDELEERMHDLRRE